MICTVAADGCFFVFLLKRRKTEASISETIQTKVAAAVVVAAVAVVDVAALVAAAVVVVALAAVDVALAAVDVAVVVVAALVAVVAVVASKSISAAWTASQNILRQVTLFSSQE